MLKLCWKCFVMLTLFVFQLTYSFGDTMELSDNTIQFENKTDTISSSNIINNNKTDIITHDTTFNNQPENILNFTSAIIGILQQTSTEDAKNTTTTMTTIQVNQTEPSRENITTHESVFSDTLNLTSSKTIKNFTETSTQLFKEAAQVQNVTENGNAIRNQSASLTTNGTTLYSDNNTTKINTLKEKETSQGPKKDVKAKHKITDDVHVPYEIESDYAQTLWVEHEHHNPHFNRKHHLQLVPMEDEPFGAMIVKDERYLVSVMIPIGVGILGAVVIIATLYTLRYIARRQGAGNFPINDWDTPRTPCISSDERYLVSVMIPIGVGILGAVVIIATLYTLRYIARRQGAGNFPINDWDTPRTPCISSISSERTDKIILLGADEDDEF